MNKKSLKGKLKNTFLTGLTVASLGAATLFYGCDRILGGGDPDPIKPVAEFVAEPIEGYAPLEVSFDGTDSYSEDGDIKRYVWAFGDGRKDSVSGPLVEYKYQNPGEYEPSLTVVSNSDVRDRKTLEDKILVKSTASLPKIAFMGRSEEANANCFGSSIFNDDIYVGTLIDGELKNLERLTDDSCQDFDPNYSPNGREIVFTSLRTGGTAVWRMNANGGGNQRDISSHLVERARTPDWCSNDLIAVSYRDNGDTEAGIGIINLSEDSFISVYSELKTGRIPSHPGWSPDCSEIVFQKYDNGNWEIYKMDSDGSDLVNLTNNSETDQIPSWSPNEEEILFVSDRDKSYDIYLMNPDGNNLKKVTKDPGIELDPAFSSDGSKIVFAYDKDVFDDPKLYVINRDGTGWKRIFSEISVYPAWQPEQ